MIDIVTLIVAIIGGSTLVFGTIAIWILMGYYSVRILEELPGRVIEQRLEIHLYRRTFPHIRSAHNQYGRIRVNCYGARTNSEDRWRITLCDRRTDDSSRFQGAVQGVESEGNEIYAEFQRAEPRTPASNYKACLSDRFSYFSINPTLSFFQFLSATGHSPWSRQNSTRISREQSAVAQSRKITILQ